MFFVILAEIRSKDSLSVGNSQKRAPLFLYNMVPAGVFLRFGT
jgi:hypothetical protein